MSDIEGLHLEWKSEWNEKCLQTLCAFANTEGGKLVIGLNNNGQPIEVSGIEHMLEKIPQTISAQLGVVARVEKHMQEGKNVLQIKIQTCKQPLSFKGRYYVRSGSVTRVLSGHALTEFLFKKMSRKLWDSRSVEEVSVEDFNDKLISKFITQSVQQKRLPEDVVSMPKFELLDSQLGLIQNKQITNAALLCFHSQPERFVPEAIIKIGYFKTEADLVHHDEVRGSIFQQVEEALDILMRKYLKALISYKVLDRIEKLPIPVSALREVLINAVMHKDYSVASAVRIQVFADKIRVLNPCSLPDGMEVQDLIRTSRQLNPLVAQMFFFRGWVEKWGRGIANMKQACIQSEVPEPIITTRCADKEFCVEFANHELEIDSYEQNPNQRATNILSYKALKEGKQIDQIVLHEQNNFKKKRA